MKFLDIARLNSVTSFLDNCTVGDRRLRGRVECYSCKPAGDDKKLHKVLDQQYQVEYTSSGSAGTSPGAGMPTYCVGALNDSNNRRLLINLICTMNATFPDYDFSGLKPDQFTREHLGVVINAVNNNLSEIVFKQSPGFMEELWGAIDQEIDLKKCEVFSYVPDLEGDPFNVPGSTWSFNYFFHNASERKILFFTCCCTTRSAGSDFYGVAREEDLLSDDDDVEEDKSRSDDDDDDEKESPRRKRSAESSDEDDLVGVEEDDLAQNGMDTDSDEEMVCAGEATI
jgi:hypothetical protein